MTQRIAPDEDDEVEIRMNGEKVTKVSVMRPTHIEEIEAPFTEDDLHGMSGFVHTE